MDSFDPIPDPLILHIFVLVSDIKTLTRLRLVCKRFNSLVPQTHSVLLKVDRVDSDDSDSSILTFIGSIFKSIHDLLSPEPLPTRPCSDINSAAQFLRGFDSIRDLEIQLPVAELGLTREKGAVVKWKAQFGKTLSSCVIAGFGPIHDSPVTGFFGSGCWLKKRVLWTITTLIAASARHYMSKEVLKEHREIEKIIVTDIEEEGIIAMNREGIKEYLREQEDEEPGRLQSNNRRTMVPNVKMKIMYAPRLELKSGVCLEGATLVLVRPTTDEPALGALTHLRGDSVEEEDAELALGLGDFGEVYGEAVQALLKAPSYLLEMNSF